MHPDAHPWDPWSPATMATRLDGITAPWYVAGGWAIDMFLGEATRPHEDIEIAVPAGRFAEIAARFPECDFHVPIDGSLHPATPEALNTDFQTWALERDTGRWRFDVFREPHDGDMWIARRDDRIRRPYPEIIRHGPDGVPYLAPEVVLLFKAKGRRDKDRADFDATLPRLDPEQRRWLRDAVTLVHPGHEWIAVI